MSSLNGKSFNPVMNRRSVIASAAGLGVAGILAGCSSEGGDSGSASANSNGGEFKIGAIGPKTGAAASYGLSVCNGVELGCKDFSNDTYNFVSKSEDDVADGEKSVTAFNTLPTGHAGARRPTTTGASVAVAEVAAQDPQIFMITPPLLPRTSPRARPMSSRCASPTPTRA